MNSDFFIKALNTFSKKCLTVCLDSNLLFCGLSNSFILRSVHFFCENEGNFHYVTVKCEF